VAADLTLLAGKRSDYQIVLPDPLPDGMLGESLRQTARLLQTAFLANGVEIAVVAETGSAPEKPSLYLGDTVFARAQGVETAKLRDWSYVHRAVGSHLILAGHDHPARGETTDSRRPNWDRVGTAKAVVDFAREYLGVRFLFPELPPYQPVAAATKIDLLATPAIEYLPRPTVTVPADLNVAKTPLLRLNTSHPAGGSFYDLAHNRFPRVDEVFGGHTWERAVPPEQYWETNPEYFALISGSRLKPEGGKAQYCLSNPDVQELIYRDLAKWFDLGYSSVDLGQPDGFRECQCESCDALHGTGKDWSEKIWISHRQVAERLEKSHPGRDVTMMSYILTANPPKTFTKFPSNTCIMLTGTNEEDLAPWRDIEVPRGFTGYVYNWCPNLGTRYTPMRTPGFIEIQVKRLAANRIQSLHRDGPGQLFGLEGPVYYTMGRMFDDPGANAAHTLLPEYCDAAFGNASAAFYMRSFYDQLYHSIALYSDRIGTRCDAWTYQPLPGEGRPRKTVQDPFQLISFLYPPSTITALDEALSLAEKQATGAKAKTRLSLVRTEFEYLRHFATVVHLHQAYQMVPDIALRDRLLDAIDARNSFIDGLFNERGHAVERDGWGQVFFPFPGHDAKHLRLAYDGYQEPYATTCFNWDTKAMRQAPAPGRKRLTVGRVSGPLDLDSPAWEKAESHELTHLTPLRGLPRRTVIRLLHDGTHLYLQAECELAPDHPATYPEQPRDHNLTAMESLDFSLAARPGREVYHRFGVTPHAGTRYDAVAGLIADAMDPRHGRDDPTWNGEWTAATRLDAQGHRWFALIAIPFQTLEATPPAKGDVWRANIARYHQIPRNQVDRALWSSSLQAAGIENRGLFGEIVFE
jgi:hypothetical protein